MAEKDNGFGKRLETYIQRSGLSLREVAKRCDVSPSTLSSWSGEGGVTPTDYKALKRICEVIEVSFEYLLTGDLPNESYNINDFYEEEAEAIYDGLAKITVVPLRRKKR